MELKDIKGLGTKRLEQLREKGILSPLDLLKIEPIKYMDYTYILGVDKKSDAIQTIKFLVESSARVAFFKGRSAVSCKGVCAVSGMNITAVWYNQPFMKNNLKLEAAYYLTGKMNRIGQFVVQSTQEVARVSDMIVPKYSGSCGIGGAVIISAIKQILDSKENFSVLSDEQELRFGLMPLLDAFSEIHFPTNIEHLELAKKRLMLENMIMLAGLEQKVKSRTKTKSRVYDIGFIREFKSDLPIKLTQDQGRVLDEILDDMQGKTSMNRLVLGDVGSGKTLVAFGAAYVACKSGFQAVLLCPTEILAEQHYQSAKKFLASSGINVALLHSKLSVSEKTNVVAGVKSGEIQFLIATHSCIAAKIEFSDLALVITDEQHRFGVGARAAIENKGKVPDVLVMSATPIPRSLSLVLFGGLSVSEIKSRPGGESRIATKIVSLTKEQDMWAFILNQIQADNAKCFVIVPRIEDGEGNLASVEKISERLKMFGVPQEFVACVHGKTEKKKAQQAITDFKNGTKKLLVSTTIVEVGIDVPDANLMVIYNAERFGLATLHQLRGRVGRDGREGYCFALSDIQNDISKTRLNIFKTCNSGSKLAEEDLKLRGAGTLYGAKQHGASEVFVNLNFSVDEYARAQEIVKVLDRESCLRLEQLAESQYGKIYENIVLN